MVYYCILEATYWSESERSNKQHEIIEFPSILWNWNSKLTYIDEFVNPSINPQLLRFCTELT